MLRKRGFTLIELLVVIAIITILAATVAPRVSNWISRGRMARAASEVRNADLALTKMLADADRKDFGTFFTVTGTALDGSPLTFGKFMQAQANIYDTYCNLFYELLRLGKDADIASILNSANVTWNQSVRKKLGSSYMDLGLDPWGKKYQFYAGPVKKTSPMMFRCRRLPDTDSTTIITYDVAGKAFMDSKLRGNPPVDYLPGLPAPRDLPVYIFSDGENGTCEQLVLEGMAASGDIYDGDDDINNWDNQSGWSDLY